MAASKRERELAKQRAERQAARRAAQAAKGKQRNAVIATVVAVLLVTVGLGVLAATLSDGGSPAETAAAPSAGASLGPGECRYEEAGEASREVDAPPTEDVETSGVYVATMTTSVGTITWNMDAGITPCTLNSMRSLAEQEYFDGTSCHRLTSQGIYVLQCGDPSGDGTGGPGYRFADENLEGATYPAGTVAMANSGPATNGSQFFLVYRDSQLPPNYTPFGRISKGLDVVRKVAAAGSEPAGDGKPKTAVEITSLRIAPRAA